MFAEPRPCPTAGWRIEDDLEPALARQAAQTHASFVVFGTRKVYAPSANPLAETDRIGPTDLYGRQKLALEHASPRRSGRG